MMSSMLGARAVGVVAGLVLAGLVLAGCAGGTSTGVAQTLPVLSSGGRAGAAAPAIAYPQPGRVEYRLGASRPAVPNHAVGYRLLADTTPARVAQVAAAFGVGGSVTSGPAGWVVSDGRHVLRVERTGGLPWNLSDTAGTGSGVAGCAVASPGVSTSPEPSSGPGEPVPTPAPAPPVTCPPPTTAPGRPQKEQAVAVARAALSRAGYDLGGATVDVSGGYDRWEVIVELAVGGVALTGSPLSLAVGPGGIEAGSGWLSEPRPSADYQLVGLEEGVRRLQEGGRWLLYGGPGPRPMMGIAQGNGAVQPSTGAGAPAPSSTCPPGAACAVPGSPPQSAPPSPAPAPVSPPGPPVTVTPPGPPATVPELPVTVRTVVGVRLALSWAFPADPSITDAWLLPVYIFELDSGGPIPGGSIPVLAIADRYVAVPPSTVPKASPPTAIVPPGLPVPATAR